MASSDTPSAQSATFNHPFEPYDIQLQFMKALYTCIEDRNVGIFESPTADDEPEWIVEASRREKRRGAVERRRLLEERLARVRAEEARQKEEFERRELNPSKRRKTAKLDKQTGQDAEAEFEPEDYDSDDAAQSASASKSSSKSDEILSAETLILLEKLGRPIGATEELEPDSEVQIFYTSRTHSQLTQFAHELRRVKLPPSIPFEEEGSTSCVHETKESLRHVPLGSRKTLCIYPPVSSLRHLTAINERCLELQRSGTPAEQRCPHIPSERTISLVNDFRDLTLAKVRDIEDIETIGNKIGLCPYYASRSVVPYSEIVTLPYPLLLQRSAREALDLQLKDQVIIIDEAHNLIDAISNLFSVQLSQTQLQMALDQLTAYARKYQKRLAGKNRVYITQVIRLVQSILQFMKKVGAQKSPTDGVCQPSDLMMGKGVDQINPHKLSRYLQESKLARKVDGFVDHTRMEDAAAPAIRPVKSTSPVLFQVHSFLLPLMNPSKEGRLFYEKTGDDVVLKYMLLDPTNHFREIVEEARAVILAGGTMSPMDDYRDYLFSYLPQDKLKTFSFGHVIPPENLIATFLPQGSLGTPFEFTYDKRGSETLIADLGVTVARLCCQIPDGVVVFFPSYDYINRVLAVWAKCTAPELSGQKVLSYIESRKPLFHEPQDRSGAVSTEDVLARYSKSISQDKGALLLSVMGGKLSEGINFSDRLGRGVIVVGLPFPNIRSAVWKAKMEHVEQKAYENCQSSITDENARRAQAKSASREFYENACLRTVNQCIGRAIRHQNDYAAIVMLDRRYGTKRIQDKLPLWIRKALVSRKHFSETTQDLTRFFKTKA
ncbi:rRNA-processing protein bfr2 [Ascosphaera pollenicola]|nr:rRNA-processing protein bfr2 [Ascosphaera pollenicola]